MGRLGVVEFGRVAVHVQPVDDHVVVGVHPRNVDLGALDGLLNSSGGGA